MAIQITREEYKKRFGTSPVFNETTDLDTKPAPIRITRAEYEEKFGNIGSALQPKALQDYQGYSSKVKEAKQAGIAEISTGYKQFKEAGVNPLKMLRAGLTGAEGVTGVLTSPFAPIFEPVSKAVEKVGEKVSNIPGVQQFAASPAGDVALSVTGDISKIANIAGTIATPELIGMKGKPTIKLTKDNTTTLTPKQQKSVNKLSDEILNIENSYQKLQKANTFEKDMGKASRDRIAQTDVLTGIVSEDGKITIDSARRAAKEYLKITTDGTEGVVRDLLKKENKKISVDEVAKELTDSVYNSGLEGSVLVSAIKGLTREIEGLKLRADEVGMIDLAKIHDAKISTTQNINYKTDSTPTIKYRKAKAAAYKKIVEDKSAVKVDGKYSIGDINKELGKYLGDAERIANLGGKGVKGSKLGKYAAQISGNIIGGVAGSAFGPAGMIVGPIVGGEAAGFIKGKQMASTFGKAKGLPVEKSGLLESAKAESQLPSQINLKIPDMKVGAPKNIPKTKDILKVENSIKKNVEQQKAAIKAGNFELVATLKEIYQVLVQKLKDAIKAVKEIDNKQGGFVRIGDYSNNLGKRNTQYNTNKTIAKNTNISTLNTKSSPKAKSTVDKIYADEITPEMANKITEELKKYNTTGLKINGKQYFDEADFKMSQLQDKVDSGKSLTKDELFVVANKLQESGINIKTPNKIIGKMEGSIKPTEAKLLEEAKKYKSAEEFVKAQGDTVYHGSPEAKKYEGFVPSKSGELGPGVYFSKDKKIADSYQISNTEFGSKNAGTKEFNISNLKIKNLTRQEFQDLRSKFFKQAQEKNNGIWGGDVYNNGIKNMNKYFEDKGYSGYYINNEKQGVIFPGKENLLKTKSQLTDIWNKANKSKK